MMEVQQMNTRFGFLLAAAAALVLSGGANAQIQDPAVQPIRLDTPADITVEKNTEPRADRRFGRSRVQRSLNDYSLRRSGAVNSSHDRVRFAHGYSGTLAYNPADPPRWAGPASGYRNFQPRITIQHRRLFNPH
jgi:hypothetical protein